MHPISMRDLLDEDLENRDPVAGNDDVYVACIKRANLNAMLGKSPLTIQNHAQESRSVVNNASLINKTPTYYARGAFPWGMPLEWVLLWTLNSSCWSQEAIYVSMCSSRLCDA
jgi:hypothetical protein